MGLGSDAEVAVEESDGVGGCGGKSCEGAVSCSICLESVADNGDRSWAKLQCGHQFHLDCIGSAFNIKGAMQCPNCRKIEKGQWLYANGCRSLPEFSMEDWNHDEDLYDLSYSEMSQNGLKATDSSSVHGTQVDFGPTAPLPDKKLLVFILDRLQKKDTRGVFSEPVDPEELPDYHEIIENPMDFGTVREKLNRGVYANLEQFEKDVFLISSNAMQYNAQDTIYFRQARAIQEIAKKDFENLRQDTSGGGNGGGGGDGDGEPKPKVARRGRPPGSKTMKRSTDVSPVERLGSQYFSDTTPTPGENSSLSNSYNLRKQPASYKFRAADTLNRGPHGSLGGETSNNWLSEMESEFPASVLRSVQRYGKKHFPVDENRRDTYKQSQASEHEPSVLPGLEGEWNQLMAVGVAMEHGYARSLARFAANLGPVVWKIASNRIGSVLPAGVKFGPGWIGDSDSSRSQQLSSHVGEDKVLCNPASNEQKDRLQCQISSAQNSVADRYSLQSGVNMENNREFNSQNGLASVNSSVSGIRHVPPFLVHQNSIIHPGMSSSDTSVPSHHQTVGMFSENNINTSMPMGDIVSGEAKVSEISSRSRNSLAPAPQIVYGGEASWQGLPINSKQVPYSLPPDLNVEFGSPGSPSSLIQIGLPQQPDLALQL